ncbi:hypothetical protein F5B22DRAFT_449818 [Xylaria bambusicola]|uniref:uncharacterized protein n=1 Tax=Xylaria bambusicola TaxID=326684 RepID=UPI00200898BE|nr:uncharacterized protein F5B22DRAFT_449818 [Xylaria bambusicola]KAI0506477.1 hypothetical protein F5B22DRAFT_449818 [Xylaria bambusicola]
MRFAGFVSLAILVEAAFSLSYSQRHNQFFHHKKRLSNGTKEYDYVVVGSGPGGGPVAANLAIAGFKVLLIDAGGDSGGATEEVVPGLHFLASEFENTAWNFWVNHFDDIGQQRKDSKMIYKMPNGTQYRGLNPPPGAEPLGILYPRAGTLGGCSRHNAMITMYPFDQDWDNIAELTGDDSWAGANMRQYFEKVEKNEYLPSSIVGHGYHGWLTTSVTYLGLVLEDFKFLNLVLSGATAAGKDLVTGLLSTVTNLATIFAVDINGPGQLGRPGLYQVPIAMKDGVRASPRERILDVANAVNDDGTLKYHLDIKLYTLVTKINFKDVNGTPRAIGVEYIEGKSLYRADARSATAQITGKGSVRASREVIVAGGAYNTPQLLKLSGIGPAPELESFGIPVVVDLPGVGTNMQDRYENAVISVSDKDYALTADCTFQLTDGPDPCLEKWEAGQSQESKGVYATNGGAVAYVLKSSVADKDADVIILGAPGAFEGYFPDYSRYSLSDKRHWSWLILKGHTRNRAGTVKLVSTDPRDMPNITFNNFAQGGEEDVQALYEAFQWSRSAMDRYIPTFGAFEENWPGRSHTDEQAIKQWLQDEAWGHHASCTCPMGADDDPMAVLDSDLKVRGVKGLRVVDASVFPRIPGFYIVTAIYTMSQKASEMIIADANAGKV